MGNIDVVVFDLDGTLYSAGVAVSGAAEAVAEVRARGIAVRFATNTFSRPAREIAERLEGFGIPIGPGELITPHDVLRKRYSVKPDTRPLAFVSEKHRNLLDYLPKQTAFFAPGRQASGPWDEVFVADSDELWSYGAFDFLLEAIHAGATLVASSAAASFIGKDGKPHLDTGAIVALLEAASGVKAVIAGKPGADMARLAIIDAGFDPKRALVIGDDPDVDVALARSIGARAVLVETGRKKIPPVTPTPDATIPSVASLPELLERM